jgi:peptidoglycan/LPS O-acetylase OafA/YrhL
MKRIPSLDGLRAISIVFVVLGHMAHRGNVPGLFWESYAYLGVRIFYVISGYLITQILLREHQKTSTISLRAFYIRRAFRIFPAALVLMVAMTAANWHQLTWFHIATAFLYLTDFDFLRSWVFAHLWSLSVEEQFYFLWPGVLKRWKRHSVAILAGVIVFSCCFEAGVFYFHGDGHWFYTFFAVAGALATGCLLAWTASRLPKVPGYLAALMVAVVVGAPVFQATSAIRTLFLVLAIRPVVHLCIAGLLLRVVQSPPLVLNIRPVVWLGQISYSLYLWQQPFCNSPTGAPIHGRVCIGFRLHLVLLCREAGAALA